MVVRNSFILIWKINIITISLRFSYKGEDRMCVAELNFLIVSWMSYFFLLRFELRCIFLFTFCKISEILTFWNLRYKTRLRRTETAIEWMARRGDTWLRTSGKQDQDWNGGNCLVKVKKSFHFLEICNSY